MGVLKHIWGDVSENPVEPEFNEPDQLNELNQKFLMEALGIQPDEATPRQIKAANYVLRTMTQKEKYDRYVKYLQIKDRVMTRILDVLDLQATEDTAGIAEIGVVDGTYPDKLVTSPDFNEGEYFRQSLYRVLRHIYDEPDFDAENKHNHEGPPLGGWPEEPEEPYY
ncbi:MAG TPA: hypothetical protein DEA55_11790 [Rhodospirillaceae bacterium]|nr:hypothetical protein [Rhodospirillaceae bacterium]